MKKYVDFLFFNESEVLILIQKFKVLSIAKITLDFFFFCSVTSTCSTYKMYHMFQRALGEPVLLHPWIFVALE